MQNKKVVSCDFKNEFKHEKFGTFYNYTVKFEGDDKSYVYAAKNQDNLYFKVGESVDFDVEEKRGTTQDGTEWVMYKLKPVKPAFNPSGKTFQKKGKAEYCAEALQFTSSYVKDLIVSGKLDLDKWISKVDEIMKYNESKINEYLG